MTTVCSPRELVVVIVVVFPNVDVDIDVTIVILPLFFAGSTVGGGIIVSTPSTENVLMIVGLRLQN